MISANYLRALVAFSKGGSDTICQDRFIYTKPNYRVQWKMSMIDSNHPAVFDDDEN